MEGFGFCWRKAECVGTATRCAGQGWGWRLQLADCRWWWPMRTPDWLRRWCAGCRPSRWCIRGSKEEMQKALQHKHLPSNKCNWRHYPDSTNMWMGIRKMFLYINRDSWTNTLLSIINTRINSHIICEVLKYLEMGKLREVQYWVVSEPPSWWQLDLLVLAG